MELSGGALVTVNAQRNGVTASFPEVHVWRLKNGSATEFASIRATNNERTGLVLRFK
jgi:hypothetical protein